MIDLNQYNLVFEENFDQLTLTSPTRGTQGWNTVFHYGERHLNFERQIYVDPDYAGMGLNPFSVSDGVATITAQPAPDNIPAPDEYYRWTGDDRYVSGLLTSQDLFSMQYGYYEFRAKYPAVDGTWHGLDAPCARRMAS
jgi:beta-glucanase (GH16 family)